MQAALGIVPRTSCTTRVLGLEYGSITVVGVGACAVRRTRVLGLEYGSITVVGMGACAVRDDLVIAAVALLLRCLSDGRELLLRAVHVNVQSR